MNVLYYLMYSAVSIVFVITLALNISSYIQYNKFNKEYKKIDNEKDLSAQEVVNKINSAYQDDISLSEGSTNYYDPENNEIKLDSYNYVAKSVGMLATIFHESGHAIDFQGKNKNKSLKIFRFIELLLLFTFLFTANWFVLILWSIVLVIGGIYRYNHEKRANEIVKNEFYKLFEISSNEQKQINAYLKRAIRTYSTSILIECAFVMILLLI